MGMLLGSPEAPADEAEAVTPSDATTFSEPTRALWVGTAGSLVVRMASGGIVTFPSASGWMPLRVTQVRAATGASNIVAVR